MDSYGNRLGGNMKKYTRKNIVDVYKKLGIYEKSTKIEVSDFEIPNELVSTCDKKEKKQNNTSYNGFYKF